MILKFRRIQKLHYETITEPRLEQLHTLLMEMVELVLYQLDQASSALNPELITSAHQVIQCSPELRRYRLRIENEIYDLLAEHHTADDTLRKILAISKISLWLKQTGDAFTEFAQNVIDLYASHTASPEPNMLIGTLKLCHLLKIILGQILVSLHNQNADQLYKLFPLAQDYAQETHTGIQCQIGYLSEEYSLRCMAMTMMQIIKTLEICCEHCNHIAKQLIYIYDGTRIEQADSPIVVNAL